MHGTTLVLSISALPYIRAVQMYDNTSLEEWHDGLTDVT